MGVWPSVWQRPTKERGYTRGLKTQSTWTLPEVESVKQLKGKLKALERNVPILAAEARTIPHSRFDGERNRRCWRGVEPAGTVCPRPES